MGIQHQIDEHFLDLLRVYLQPRERLEPVTSGTESEGRRSVRVLCTNTLRSVSV